MNLELRKESFGQAYRPTWVDRFGVALSARALRRWVPDVRGLRVGDFGCGYHATLSRAILSEAKSLVLSDVAISAEFKPGGPLAAKVQILEGDLLATVQKVPDQSLDLVLCVSVLEHVWQPEEALRAFRRGLAPGGTCLLNVPSWMGKRFLEFSAFKLGLSPAAEMDDHKMYYDPKDLWPLVVRAGFKPSRIRVFRHKFGLNTFCVARL
ncbi:MAG TPA: methyltransferase domain-containing protein [Bdellovibrionota bacterium]|nr:methyltransferase domain-containing protein [Bdellovibrionota bacterium]